MLLVGKALADAESKKLAASVAEREKWRVKDCGEEVRAGIAALKAKLSPPKPKPKIVVKDISTMSVDRRAGVRSMPPAPASLLTKYLG